VKPPVLATLAATEGKHLMDQVTGTPARLLALSR